MYCANLVRRPDPRSRACSRGSGLIPAHLNPLFSRLMRSCRWIRRGSKPGRQKRLALEQALARAWFLPRLKCPSLHPEPYPFRCRLEPAVPGSCHQRSLLPKRGERGVCPRRSLLPCLLLAFLASWSSPLAHDCGLGQRSADRLVQAHKGR